MDTLVATAQRHGVAAGFMAGSPEDAVHWIGKGFRAISLGSDIITYMTALKNNRQAVEQALALKAAQ